MKNPFRYPFLLLVGALLSGVLPGASAGELPGTLDWGYRARLGTLESGMVETVAVVEGQRVAKGALLLRLDQRGFKAELAAAQAAYRHAQVLLEEAQREFDRAQELYDRTVLSEHEHTVAVIGLREAQAAAEAAGARLVRARLALEYSELHAPFAGRVEQLDVVPGQAVNARLTVPRLVTLADESRLTVRVNGDAALLQELLAADRSEVVVAGATLPVTHIAPLGPAEGLRLVAERPAGLTVRPGQPVTVRW